MSTLNIALLGLGFMGRLHACVISTIPNAKLVALCDENMTLAQNLADEYACACYSDYNEMFKKETLDAVSICVPDEYHSEIAIASAKHELHILIEKPLARTEVECKKILEAVEAYNVRLMVAHILRFNSRYVQLQESIDRGDLGEIIHMNFTRRNSIVNSRRLMGRDSIYYYIGVHDIEMMCSYTKSRPIKVYAQKVSKLNKDIKSEDSVFTIVNFENGAIANIELTWALPENSAALFSFYAEVLGDKGIGYINSMNQELSLITKSNVHYPDTQHWPEYNNAIMGDLREEIQHFVTATLHSQPYLVDTKNAVQAVRVIEHCIQSIETSKPVTIDEQKI